MANESSNIFGGNGAFEKVFPQVKDITIEVEEIDQTKKMKSLKQVYRKDNIKPWINCSNYLTCHGGFSIEKIVSYMVRKGQTDLEETVPCEERIKSLKDNAPNKRKRFCMHCFAIKIHIDYDDSIKIE